MSQTLENLLVYGSLGAGVALLLSDHRRLGMLVAMLAPVTVAVQHPHATWSAVKKSPRVIGRTGRAVGQSAGRAGKAFGWAFQ